MGREMGSPMSSHQKGSGDLQEGYSSVTNGGFTFSEAPFEGTLRRLEGGFTFRRLQGGFTFGRGGLEGSLKEPSRGLEGTSRVLVGLEACRR